MNCRAADHGLLDINIVHSNIEFLRLPTTTLLSSLTPFPVYVGVLSLGTHRMPHKFSDFVATFAAALQRIRSSPIVVQVPAFFPEKKNTQKSGVSE